MTSSNGNIFRFTGHLCGEFTGNRWILRTKASDAELWCFDLPLNKRLSKQSWGWWFETPSHPLWIHCNEFANTPMSNPAAWLNLDTLRITLTLPWSGAPPVFRAEWVLLSQNGYSLFSGCRSGHSSQQGKTNCGVYFSQQASWSPSVMGRNKWYLSHTYILRLLSRFILRNSKSLKIYWVKYQCRVQW